jgi:hypothetical protein
MTTIFVPALESLSREQNGVFGPTSFRKYLLDNNLPSADTARNISVDTYERLNDDLKQHQCMVLRLGASEENNTKFALIKIAGHLNDFFLFDDEATSSQVSTFLPTASFRQLYPYQLLGLHSETALVNLGFASGLISHSLGLDEEELGAPATGQSIFSFRLSAHKLLDTPLEHNNGQVQIDALFIGKRDKQECLFIIEAKTKGRERSLAKHKLVYPIMALAKQVPKDITIIPVYIKTQKVSNGIIYHVFECSFPDPRDGVRSIDELKIARHTGLLLPLSIVSG